MIVGSHAGELFAFGAAVCWAIGPLIAYVGVDRIGVFRFSMYRFCMSTLALAILAALFGQTDWSDGRVLGLLAVSGVVGVAFGEACLFQAIHYLGPRIASIIFSLHSPITAFVGAHIFEEEPDLTAVVGITIAVTGVVLATVFRSRSERAGGIWYKVGRVRLGLVLAGGAVVFQVAGALLAKEAAATVGAFFGSFIRTASAAVIFFPIFLALRERGGDGARGAMRYVACSAAVSTVGGMTFLLAAFANTEIFRAVVISSLAPVIYILLMSVIRRERFPAMVWLGTGMALAGTAMMI